MKKSFIKACGWAVALLMGSIAGGCSSASKAARSSASSEEDADSKLTPDAKEEQLDTMKIDRPVNNQIRLLYGVRPVDYELKDK